MPSNFAEIMFTPSVRAAQTRYGSRAINQRFELAEDPGDTLGPIEAAFVEERDGFYQATVNENGWPYVQFRGGPAGFLKVLDERTIGYADFRGNIQYLSVGNLADNDRIAMILMDYPNRRRLKIWARARLVHHDEDPELLARLEVPTYRARVERAVVMTIEAIEWNCPQHITPRFTEADIDELVAPLRNRIAELEATAGDSLAASSGPRPVIGDGPLELVITGIRQLTPEVRAYELRRPDFEELPAVTAGSHIEIPVPFDDGRQETRTYSISSNPNRRDAYEIAVRLDPDGRGGSRAVHERYALGLRIRASLPRNAFSLHEDGRPAVLVAGGIGITPLKAMAQSLKADGRAFHLHYAARSQSHMAYRSKLALALNDAVTFYPGDEGRRIDVEALLSDAPADAMFYVCGPDRLIDAVRRTADAIGFERTRVRYELFSTATPEAGDTAFQVHLARSGTELTVAHDQTLLDALLDADIDADYGCKSGTCGMCAMKVLEGRPMHRDSTLSDEERDRAGLMCPCVSRAESESLVLDL
ncbi:MAG: 2Fe-2S iron-sulfur cluster binding domain-containing protein [Alphaproteobacteria bacterium]|nr:2Fe-2S iron-sulfur cluster binding domain-containing protein [Alphaproteobacteria bacterium]